MVNEHNHQAAKAMCATIFERSNHQWLSPGKFNALGKKYFGSEAQKLLSISIEQGWVEKGRRGDVRLVRQDYLSTATVEIGKDARVRLRDSEGQHLNVREVEIGDWMHLRAGDQVTFRTNRNKTASIQKVIYWQTGTLHADVLSVRGSRAVVRCPDGEVMDTILVDIGKGMRLEDGDRVVVELDRRIEGKRLRGQVVQVGTASASIDDREQELIDEFNLRTDMIQLSDEQVQRMHERHQQEMTNPHRKDLRAMHFVTIDGETAKDFDDAVCIKKHNNGYTVWVAIADVDFFVEEDSPLDLSAREKGTSTYFPGKVFPMLPKVLSEDLCSLRPDQDRLAMVVVMEFDPEGRRLESEFYEGVIRSHFRLTYGQAKQCIDGLSGWDAGSTVVAEQLPLLIEFGEVMRVLRTSKGGLDFDVPEPFIQLGLQGEVASVLRNERHMGHMLIEELMIAANEAVAECLTSAGYPVVYRVHNQPPKDKATILREVMKAFGQHVPEEFDQQDLQSIIQDHRGLSKQKVLTLLILRAMAQAEYTTEFGAHWGLVSECYCHFTSPIRRYPDLINHRWLRRYLQRGDMPQSVADRQRQKIESLAKKLNELERQSEKAERKMVQHLQMQFAAQRLGETTNAMVVSVTSFGLFVELEDPFCDGLVHISNLGNDHWVYNEQAAAIYGKRSGRQWCLGDELIVRIERVDLTTDRMDLVLV